MTQFKSHQPNVSSPNVNDVIPDKILWKDFKQALPGPLGRRAGARSNAFFGRSSDFNRLSKVTEFSINAGWNKNHFLQVQV